MGDGRRREGSHLIGRKSCTPRKPLVSASSLANPGAALTWGGSIHKTQTGISTILLLGKRQWPEMDRPNWGKNFTRRFTPMQKAGFLMYLLCMFCFVPQRNPNNAKNKHFWDVLSSTPRQSLEIIPLAEAVNPPRGWHTGNWTGQFWTGCSPSLPGGGDENPRAGPGLSNPPQRH